MRLATINIASGRDTDGVTRLPVLGRALAELGADVIAMQEVDHLLPRSGTADQTAALQAAVQGDGPAWEMRFAAALHGTPGPGDGSRPAHASLPAVPSYGVALLSRHPVVRTHELRLAPARGRRPIPLPPGSGAPVWFIRDEQRVALAAELSLPSGTLTVVTTHLSFAPGRAAVQLRQLRTWATDLPRPLVLMGDLNLPGAVPRLLTGWTSLGRVPTFPAARPRVQLDHALADGPTGAVAPARAVPVGGSDHRGLIFDMQER
ncbi:endonuclease/exonuclease/phosphatase family protein [Aeromicrobium wangtongii]|uniref:Endonuclease/exonuclease/phosphatase family protein n=1 Tax=Aeromicrobium wangtongii TaxID=2969247 RepID=A0ABY5MC21_9ACTN|nr:endonuclease/exonuclease/phosphatase family protein [Aeromicrobium wangtongii]MCD9196723.1 endonuclease/exonuclease/phosphatase family protein [Aeromicrobium wangtongii]UUP14233.1 endonuclease/exonuclease/phosphatase family protein [Aeromicrobium wangtongii]